MALEGSLTDFGLADILQLIYFQRKTGILSLAGKQDKVKLLFVDGNIIGAESKRRIEDNRIGKILMKKGIIKDSDLKAVLDEQKKTGVKIGNILINKELVDKEIVFDILKSQITETVMQLFNWKQGTYEFSTQGIPQETDLSFTLDTQHLLMEGLRLVDEWSVIKGKISLDTLFKKKSDNTATLLSDLEKEIFALVDGESDVSTIIDLSGKDNFEVSKTMLSLIEKNLIETIETVKIITSEEVAGQDSSEKNIFNYLAPVAILASLLLSVAIVLIFSNDGFLKRYRASAAITTLRAEIEVYKIEHSAYPAALSEISRTQDPWGHPYIYKNIDNVFTLFSAGPDGSEGTADDVN